MATALNFWITVEITTEKNQKLLGSVPGVKCVSVRACCIQYSHTSKFISRLTYVSPLLRRRNHQTSKPSPGPSLNNNSVHASKWCLTGVIAVLGFAALPAGCCVSPEGLIWSGVWVGRSCCVKVCELLWVVLPSESCSSGVHFHQRHLVTAKPV